MPDTKRRASGNDGETVTGGLQVKEIDGLVDKNSEKHHTDDYETDALFLRRGDTFDLEILSEKPYKEGNQFHLEFRPFNGSKRGKTFKAYKETDSNDKYDWTYKINEAKDTKLLISVFIPVDALVSRYTLTVIANVVKDNKKSRQEFKFPLDVYVLFNAWCKDDECYMEDDYLRSEYVMNDRGAVYQSGCRGRPWYFAQFTEAAVKVAFKLLETVTSNRRDNAREVARHMSAMANSMEFNRHEGLLVGNWSGDYSGGAKPWEWSGSHKIFKKFLETGKPVEYGQCWVFSGLITSLMRTLGMPTRSVTNYGSAHDTDNNCTFDKYFDEDMNYMEDESNDSCWNFHVWNDVWMTRPDLPDGMGGWQAIDGTPQEESRGVYRCGPAPLLAIKEGNVNYNYDTKFIFAEVNADQIYWQKNADEWKVVRIDSRKVGKDISTKKPNSYWREDITHQYKHPEGSMLERAAVRNAMKKSKNPAIPSQPNDVHFSSKLAQEANFDAGVELTIYAKNTSDKPLTIDCVVTAHIVRYTGVTLQKLKQRKVNQTLAGKEETALNFKFEPSEYIDQLDENITIRFSYMTRVKETNQHYVNQKVCDINKPELSLKLMNLKEAKVKAGDDVEVEVTLPKLCNLQHCNDCILNFDGSILKDDVTFNIEDLSGKDEIKIKKTFQVKKNVKKNKPLSLLVTFSSKQLSGISSEMEFQLEASEE